jgi:DHA1 family bicyclomycin/chloramphenicol resistance-like MFS transporter
MKNFSTILLLSLIAIVGIFTLDVYLPGMPAMAKEFDVSITQIGFTFTGFAIVFAISQIFHGMLSDYFGRKPILLGGLIIAAVATAFCITAKNYESLLVARIIQAMGISAFVVVNAIIRDLYTGVKAIQVRTFVTTVSGVSLSIAPTIGGLLQNHFDWQGGFMSSLLLIVITFFYALLFLPESNGNKNQSKLSIASFAKSYGKLFSDNRYVLHIILATLAYTVHFTFIIMSANIFINLLGFTPLTFGYLMFIYGGVYFVSGLITASIAKKYYTSHLIKSGGMFIGAGGILLLILSLLFPSSAIQILLPMALMTMGITIVRSTATTGALAPIPTQAGQGAAGLNLIQFMLSAVIASGVNELGFDPQYSLALLAIICAASIVFLINVLNRTSAIAKQILTT